jgi:adenosylmethionine-8-amino-7-oxononanoate aminotransferase
MSSQATQFSDDDGAPRREQLDATNEAPLREQLDATTRALAAAHNEPVLRANAGVRWERRGLLQRLVRRARG